MVTIEGTVIKQNKSDKSDTYFYEIKKTDGYYVNVIRFKHPIEAHHKVKISYTQKKNFNHKCSNIVDSVEYIGLLSEKNSIKHFLRKIVLLSEKTTNIIYDKFKKNTIDVLVNNPTNISTKKDALLTILPNQHTKIKKYFNSVKFSDLIQFFDKFDVRYDEEMLKELDALKITIKTIINNPYVLAIKSKIPFSKLDEIASKLGGIDKFWVLRIEPLINYIYKIANSNGYIYLTEKQFGQFCTKKKITVDNQTMIVIKNLLIKIIVDEVQYYTTKKFYYLERFVEKFVSDKQKKCTNNEIYFDAEIDADQELAVRTIVDNSISIIDGPPGTGKSYVITKAIDALPGTSIILALTGSAVQNIKAVVKDTVCSTIHRFLYYNCGSDNNQNELDNVLKIIKDNKRLNVFIDEMSMVPFCLFCELLKKLNKLDKIRLVLVGDCNQLPCIEGGNVFNDLISHSGIPKITLTNQHRAESKHIVDTAFLALIGKNIEADNKSVYIINEDNQTNISKILIEVVKNNRLNYDNTCFVSPRKQNNPLACDKINLLLQNYYNVGSNKLVRIGDFNIKANDKLIYKKNDPKLDLYNGSIIVAKNYREKRVGDDNFKYQLECRSDSGRYYLEKDNFENLELGYAITVHSAQGKGYDNVVMLLHSHMGEPMLYRKLLYTAITRAKKKCIIICDNRSLQMCKKIIPPRVTNLFQFNEKPDYLIQLIFNKSRKIIMNNYESESRRIQYNSLKDLIR